MDFGQLMEGVRGSGQTASGYKQNTVGGGDWRSGLSQAMSGAAPTQPTQPQPESAPVQQSPLGYPTVDSSNIAQGGELAQYGELNPHPMEGMETGLLNSPYQEPGLQEYGNILGNILAPTKAGLYQMYGEDSALGGIETTAHKALDYIPGKAAEIMGGGKLGNFLAYGNPFDLFG